MPNFTSSTSSTVPPTRRIIRRMELPFSSSGSFTTNNDNNNGNNPEIVLRFGRSLQQQHQQQQQEHQRNLSENNAVEDEERISRRLRSWNATNDPLLLQRQGISSNNNNNSLPLPAPPPQFEIHGNNLTSSSASDNLEFEEFTSSSAAAFFFQQIQALRNERLASFRNNIQNNQQQQQQHVNTRNKTVYKLYCTHCSSLVSIRAMRAILLADMKVELFSTDLPPKWVNLVNEDYGTTTCKCQIRDIACLTCGNVLGYHVTQPCETCLDARNNGHFWMFYSESVTHKERIDSPKKYYIGDLWLQLKLTKTGLLGPTRRFAAIIEKAAAYVAKHGSEFEDRLAERERNSSRFSFLKVSDPYHEFYQSIVAKNRGISNNLTTQLETSDGFVEGSSIPKPSSAHKKLLHENDYMAFSNEVPSTPPFEFILPESIKSISPLDIEVMKLTAMMVARNGRSFALALAAKESNNAQFDFLKANHSYHIYFTKLVEMYTKILLPSKSLLSRLQIGKDPKHRMDSLSRIRQRVKVQQQQLEQQQQLPASKQGRGSEEASLQIDWHDFVVVQTVLFTQEERENPSILPKCLDLAAFARMSLSQKKELLSSEIAKAKTTSSSAGSVGVSFTSSGNEADFVVKTPASKQPHQICPLCKGSFPSETIEEHIRIELLDPKWKSQRSVYESKIAETNLVTSGSDVSRYLEEYAKNRASTTNSTASSQVISSKVIPNLPYEKRDYLPPPPQPLPSSFQPYPIINPSVSAFPPGFSPTQPPVPPYPYPFQPPPSFTPGAPLPNAAYPMQMPPQPFYPPPPTLMPSSPQQQFFNHNMSMPLQQSSTPFPPLVISTPPPPIKIQKTDNYSLQQQSIPDSSTILPPSEFIKKYSSDPQKETSFAFDVQLPVEINNGALLKSIHLKLDATIASIKEQIIQQLSSSSNLSVSKLKLFTKGNAPFKNESSLAFYNVVPGSLLQVALKERGGRK